MKPTSVFVWTVVPVALPAGFGATLTAVIGSVSGPVLRSFDRLVDQWPGFAPGDPARV